MDILILCLVVLIGWAVLITFRPFSRRRDKANSPRHEGSSQERATVTSEPAGLANMPKRHSPPLTPDNEHYAFKGQQPVDTAVSYKGYIILPVPRHLADLGLWEVNLYISLSATYGAVTRQFFTLDTYRTEEEAVAHCITYGQQIIDGKIPGSTVG